MEKPLQVFRNNQRRIENIAAATNQDFIAHEVETTKPVPEWLWASENPNGYGVVNPVFPLLE